MLGKWKKLKTEEIYQCGKWYRVEKDKVLTPGNTEGTYYLIRSDNDSVVIIAIDKNKKLHLTNQHRYSVDKFSLEFPAGWTDKEDKDSLESAKRELLEETGLISNNWKIIGNYIQLIGATDMKMSIALATDCSLSKNNIEKDPLDKNLHKNVTLDYSSLKDKISKGDIFDQTTLCAFAIAEAQGVFDKYKERKS